MLSLQDLLSEVTAKLVPAPKHAHHQILFVQAFLHMTGGLHGGLLAEVPCIVDTVIQTCGHVQLQGIQMGSAVILM